jgi:uncharacterized LabA/DUF88 family protein
MVLHNHKAKDAPVIFDAYIDGFNLYKGVLETRPSLKWLDLNSFCRSLRPDMTLGSVHYFTAPVKERFPGDNAPRRQEKYLRVLRNQGIDVIRGKFIKNNSWLRVASTERSTLIQPNLASHFGLTQLALNSATKKAQPDLPKAQVTDMEEKGSDVNLASHLLRDVYVNKLLAALVITGDSDLVTPIQFAVSAGANIKVVVPRKEQPAHNLRQAATHCEHLDPSQLSDHQLSKTFITPQGRQIVRPEEWT